MSNGIKNICSFCDSQDLLPRIVYRDNLTFAFLSNIPIVPGHVLVCPVRHVTDISELLDVELLAIKKTIILTRKVLQKSLGAEGFNFAWNEKEMAGQSVPHLHFHIIPRKTGDSGVYEYEPRKFLYRPGSRCISPEEELLEISDILKKGF